MTRWNSRLKWNGLKPAARATSSRVSLEAKFASINATACWTRRCCASALPASGSRGSVCKTTATIKAVAKCSKYGRPLGQPCSVSSINSWQSKSIRRLITKRGAGTERKPLAGIPARRKTSSTKRGWASQLMIFPAARDQDISNGLSGGISDEIRFMVTTYSGASLNVRVVSPFPGPGDKQTQNGGDLRARSPLHPRPATRVPKRETRQNRRNRS